MWVPHQLFHRQNCSGEWLLERMEVERLYWRQDWFGFSTIIKGTVISLIFWANINSISYKFSVNLGIWKENLTAVNQSSMPNTNFHNHIGRCGFSKRFSLVHINTQASIPLTLWILCDGWSRPHNQERENYILGHHKI